VQFEYREIRDTIRLEQTAKNSSTYLDFFRTKGNRYRLLLLISMGFFSQWSGNAIVSNYSRQLYENVGIETALARLGLSAGLTTMSTIVSIFFALQVDRWGRRPLWLIATGGMLVSLVVWTICFRLYEGPQSPGSEVGVIFFIWLHGFFYMVAWSGLLIAYAIEILPYSMRAKGLMILNICVQGALALNNQANPVAFEHWEGQTYILYAIYVCWVAFEFVIVYFFYIETKGPTLEEIVKIIDGPDAKVALIDLGKVEDDVAHHSVDEKRDVEQVDNVEVKRTT
jgi:MFS family permease